MEPGGVRQERVTAPRPVIYTQLWFVLAHLLAFSG